jgi:hypothetical protein
MIKVTLIETVYPAPDGEGDYCPDPIRTDSWQEDLNFRDLICRLESFNWLSSTRRRADEVEFGDWACAEANQDWRNGEWTERSIHLHRDNAPGALKYWRAALRAALIVK